MHQSVHDLRHWKLTHVTFASALLFPTNIPCLLIPRSYSAFSRIQATSWPCALSMTAAVPAPLVPGSSANVAKIYIDLIANIQDPEHPLTLGSLSVVNLPDISLAPTLNPSDFPNNISPITTLTVLLTPTVTHCSLATVIGLGVRVRLEQALPPRFRVDVRIKEGTHSTAEQVNKQLGDKERVAAALENGTLMGVLRKMLEGC